MSDCQWTYQNGTAINYNFTGTGSQDCICVASFPADPDIAGPGVLASFITTAWLTCLVAATGAYCSLAQAFSEYLEQDEASNSSSKFDKVVDRFSPSGYSLERHPSSITNRVRASSFKQNFSDSSYRWISRILSLFRYPRPRMQRFARLTLDNLCSLQLVIGTAVLIAAMVQIKTMSYYHQQIVMNYWFLNLSSFWAARAGDLSQSEDKSDWRYWTRTVVLFCTAVLSIYYQIVAIPRRLLHWDPVSGGRCFIYHDKSGWAQSFVWIGGLIIYATYIFIVLLSGIGSGGGENWLDKISNSFRKQERIYRKKYIAKKRAVLEVYSSARITDSHPYNQTRPTRTASNTLVQNSFNRTIHVIIGIMFNIPLIIWYLFRQFLALIAWGDPKSVLLVLGYFGFAAWSTYSIVDLKVSNRALLEDSELSWGFGQVLPVVLLGLIVLNILDAAKEAQHDARNNGAFLDRRETDGTQGSMGKMP